MNLDPRTMVLVMITSTLLIGGGLLAVTRGYFGAVTGAYRWAVATLIQSAGWFITGALRGVAPDVVSVILGPCLIQAGLMIYLFVLHDFEAVPVERRWYYALLTADLILATCFAVLVPGMALRPVITAATAGTIALRSAYVLWSGPNARVASHRFMAGVFAVCGLIIVARGVAFLVADQAWVTPTAPNVVTSVSLMVFYVVAVVVSFGFVLMCNDRYASQRAHAENALHAAALVDALTKLPNRAMVTNRLSRLSADANPGDGLYAVLFIDINNFKYVNDSLGHQAGDQLLIDTGERLTNVVRSRDTVTRRPESVAGRFGGDEFVLILERLTAPEEAAAVADRILHAMAAPFTLEGQRVTVQCSIGISISGRTGRGAATEDLLREADTAMYRAKSAGGASFVIFDESMHVQARRRLTLESDLRAALESNQIRAHYQPIVNLSTGSITAFEALARWTHPEHGVIPPDMFIPIAEETGLIVQVGQRMLEQAAATLEQMNRLPGGDTVCMNVNVSRRELMHPGFLANVRDTVAALSVAPRRLRLEITETAVSGFASVPVSELLRELKALGVEIHLDDFGTGQSSLSLLRSLPLDGIKIDRSFIERSTGDVQAITILNAIVALGRNLGKAVTVEGVADTSQVSTVLALEGDLVQGYLFGKPMPAAEAETLLGVDFSPRYVAA
ncbi:MAG: EAL domain-containing protein [Vicinamibacterales bacterium]